MGNAQGETKMSAKLSIVYDCNGEEGIKENGLLIKVLEEMAENGYDRVEECPFCGNSKRGRTFACSDCEKKKGRDSAGREVKRAVSERSQLSDSGSFFAMRDELRDGIRQGKVPEKSDWDIAYVLKDRKYPYPWIAIVRAIGLARRMAKELDFEKNFEEDLRKYAGEIGEEKFAGMSLGEIIGVMGERDESLRKRKFQTLKDLAFPVYDEVRRTVKKGERINQVASDLEGFLD